jgi:hypothetical protein
MMEAKKKALKEKMASDKAQKDIIEAAADRVSSSKSDTKEQDGN